VEPGLSTALRDWGHRPRTSGGTGLELGLTQSHGLGRWFAVCVGLWSRQIYHEWGFLWEKSVKKTERATHRSSTSPGVCVCGVEGGILTSLLAFLVL